MDPVNATGLNYIYEGKLLDAMRITLESTFLGIWIWLLIILVIDAVIYIKSRNPILTSIVNLILVYIYASSLPLNAFMFLIVPSALALVGAIYFVFR